MGVYVVVSNCVRLLVNLQLSRYNRIAPDKRVDNFLMPCLISWFAS